MAIVQDPAFWKRFNTAVQKHNGDIECGYNHKPNQKSGSEHGYPASVTNSPLLHSSKSSYISDTSSLHKTRPISTVVEKKEESWLARQEKKKKKRTLICWAFWIGFIITGVGIAAIVIVLIKTGIIGKLGEKINGVNHNTST